jgi:endonuclease/exonuclease/phosphatase family metal-dependent hydrolase
MENKHKNFRFLSLLMKLFTALTFLCLFLSYLAPYFHPKTITILPFFGICYPIFLMATLFFLVFWSILRSKWAVFCLFTLIIGGKLHFRSIAIQLLPTETESKNSLSILSYNVRLFGIYQANSYANRDNIFAYLRKENPDVACFQEYYQQDKPTKFETFDSLTNVLKFVDYHARTAHRRKGRKNFGVAIFSKYPMIARGDVIFDSQGKADLNYCIFSDIIKNKDTFRIYNVHLQSIKLSKAEEELEGFMGENTSEDFDIINLMRKLKVAYQKRAEQARKIISHMKKSPHPTIVCGDFNDTPMSYTYNQFDRLLIDAFRNSSLGVGSTYMGRLPAGRIDYIFHSPDLNSSSFNIQKDIFSDHLAISCKIYKQ